MHNDGMNNDGMHNGGMHNGGMSSDGMNNDRTYPHSWNYTLFCGAKPLFYETKPSPIELGPCHVT